MNQNPLYDQQMNSVAASDVHCLRVPADKPDPGGESAAVEEEAAEPSPEETQYIICRQCRQTITRPVERISIQGSHQHTFANPHGVVFEIGCFKDVTGCGYAGAATDEFSWFAGYSWRICFCSMCLTHLGWIFSSNAGDIFHALILDRIIQPD
jgi:hypothetical protein